MDFQQALEGLEKNSLFRDWRKEHCSAYLVHFFWMPPENIHIGYYEPAHDVLTSFILAEKITKKEETEIFKEQNSIPLLAMDLVKIKLQEALSFALHQQKEKYPHDAISKQILFLQTIDGQPAYNMTFITETFKFLHILIHATTGVIVREEMQPLFNLVNTIDTKK